MQPEIFLDGRVSLYCGDCLVVLKTMPDASVDSVVTDPPYHLTSIVKRFGAENAAPAQVGQTGAYARASAGFMGKQWDGGDVAFRAELWAEVLRVLKPGGHLIAFGGTRTYHRMACAIEDAGFEIRDMIGWLYGSGFPKSHNVSKGIDRMKGAERKARATGKPVKRMIPGAAQNKHGWEKNSGREYVPSESDPVTPEAQAWDGWGTALKPAQEPICLARKPLVGTVAENVIKHGCGALNIGACTVDFSSPASAGESKGKNQHADFGTEPGGNAVYGDFSMVARKNYDPEGRWPANIIHDGSDEVVGAFPESGPSRVGNRGLDTGIQGGKFAAGERAKEWLDKISGHDDNGGSAARFFYTAKADDIDRLGSNHPTVKPLDLKQYLCRLITPPGGTVLDLFAGTGTTGEAAWREGFRALLIERETEYQADIRRRMAFVLSGIGERSREAGKQKAKRKPISDGPLFGGAVDSGT